MDKEYTNGEITIKWQPKLCQHAGICVKTLPQVYKPNESPWISIANASTELMKVMARACGHNHLNQFNPMDITSWKKNMADLTGIKYAGM